MTATNGESTPTTMPAASATQAAKPAATANLKTNYFALLLYVWLWPLLKTDSAELPDQMPAWDAHSRQRHQTVTRQVLEQYWKPMQTNRAARPSLLVALGLRLHITGGVLLECLYLVSHLGYPLLLEMFLGFMKYPDSDPLYGGLLVAAMVSLLLLRTWISSIIHMHGLHVQQTIHTGLTAVILAKVSATQDLNSGSVVDLLKNEVLSVASFGQVYTQMLSPMTIIANFLLLYWLMGMAAFACLGLAVVLQGLSFYFSSQIPSLQEDYSAAAALRLAKMTETLDNLMGIKSFNKEQRYINAIQTLRNKEVQRCRSFIGMYVWEESVRILSTPLLTALVMLLCYYLQHGIDPQIVFPAMLLLDFHTPVSGFLFFLRGLSVSRKSLATVQAFLVDLDTEHTPTTRSRADGDVCVDLKDVVWTYLPDQLYQLHCSELTVSQPCMVGVYGRSCSGKSTFLKGLLGELQLSSGQAIVNASVSYASQAPFILASTVQQNILLGSKLDVGRLDRVLAIAELTADIQQLPNGMTTSLASHDNILGPLQQVKLGLARALYKTADVYLLDDFFALLDVSTAQSILAEIKDFLGDKLVFFACSSVALVSCCDTVVVMQEGSVKEHGSVQQLRDRGGVLASEMALASSDTHCETDGSSTSRMDSSQTLVSLAVTSLTVQQMEVIRNARITDRMGNKYLRLFGIKTMAVLSVVLVISLAASMAAPTALVLFASNTASEAVDTFLMVFTGLFVLEGFSSLLCYYFFVQSSLRVSSRLFSQSLKSLLSASIPYFRSIPLHSILHSFKVDLRICDVNFASSLGLSTVLFALVIPPIALSCQVSRYLALANVVFIWAAWKVNQLYFEANSQMRHLAQQSRSQTYLAVENCMLGVETLRCFDAHEITADIIASYVEKSQGTEYIVEAMSTWLSQRSSLLSCLMVGSVGCIACVTASDAYFTYLVGVTLVYAAEFGSLLKDLFQNAYRMHEYMAAFERINEYATQMQQEGPGLLPDDRFYREWPAKGAITYTAIQVTQGSAKTGGLKEIIPIETHIQGGGTVLVLDQPKSSHFSETLFRLVDCVDGDAIYIDGVDTAPLGLITLRSRLHLLSHPPLLFQGSIRSNFGAAYPDETIWEGLSKAGLLDWVSELPEQLDAPISLNVGDGWTLDRMKLLCVARTLVMRPKIVIVDEMNRSARQAFDTRSIEIIREHLVDSTIIVLSHVEEQGVQFDQTFTFYQGILVELESVEMVPRPNAPSSKAVDGKHY
ncbi:hypothetical protein HDV03_000620 [Kappamyces sp. JEL0829]|nr:hypothetical protein HDV03_000620 [Kappamyces sp. JEL0829]